MEKNRKYIIRHSEAEGEPVIKSGLCYFYDNETDLVPDGYRVDVVSNTPDLKTIFVKLDD